ncbi:hypothetical protein AA313_de0207000 [Arthrobotrys entomopaga]|nr:hypothetical protein AA313_de0207000 [Arthrobotrys entomopaga]
MLATYLSRDPASKTAIQDAIQRIKDLSVVRTRGGVPIISNGVTPDEWPASDRQAVGYSTIFNTKRDCFLKYNEETGHFDCIWSTA